MIASIFRWATIGLYAVVILFSIPIGVYFWAGAAGDPPLQSMLYATAFYWGVTGLSAVAVRLWECFGLD